MCYYPFFPGANLPDDDYATLVPPIKPSHSNTSQKTATSNGDKENRPSLGKSFRREKESTGRKITITAVSARRSTIENDWIEQSRSAPASPALNHLNKRRSSGKKIPFDQLDHKAKSVSIEHCSTTSIGPSTSLSSGQIEIRLKYDAKHSKIWIFVLKATLDTANLFPQQTLVQIHLTALPNKRIRYRTRVKPIDNAMFAEEFFFKVPPDGIQYQGIRFRLYTSGRFKREKLLAEAIVMFSKVNLDEDMCKIIPFERVYRSQDSDLGNRTYSRQDSVIRSQEGLVSSLLPELEIGLAYDRIHSMLILEIGKGINFSMSTPSRAPDAYVQITLRNSNGEDLVSNRTATRYTQHHPVFAERYPFNIQEDFLEQITIIITVVYKKSANKSEQDYATISFGREASSNLQSAHWQAMFNAQGETITRWHVLNEKINL